MLSTVKDILAEHNLSNQGEGNAHVALPTEPKEGNFDGKIWYNTSNQSHYIWYDGKYRAISSEKSESYGGMVRKTKTSDGIFEIVEKLDSSGKVIQRSTLSQPDKNGLFTKRVIESGIGTSSPEKLEYKLTYDSDGDLISEKLI